MNHTLKDGDNAGAELAARWLVSQLKVALRPLWGPAADALAAIAERFGDVVWELVFGQLKDVEEGEGMEGVEGTAAWVGEEGEEEDPISEKEKVWRDPSAHKLRLCVVRRLSGRAARIAIVQVSGYQQRGRRIITGVEN